MRHQHSSTFFLTPTKANLGNRLRTPRGRRVQTAPRRVYTSSRTYFTRARAEFAQAFEQAAERAPAVEEDAIFDPPSSPPSSATPASYSEDSGLEDEELPKESDQSNPISDDSADEPDERPFRNIRSYRRTDMSFPTSAEAKLVWASPTKPPILSIGDPTPFVLQQWISAVRGFQAAKAVADDRIVPIVMAGLQDSRLRQWCEYERDRLIGLDLDAFYRELQREILPSDWADRVRIQLLGSRQGGRNFWDWQLEVTGLNFSLPAERRLSQERLHEFLEANLNSDLQARLRIVPAVLEASHEEQVLERMTQLVLRNLINQEAGTDTVPIPAEVPPPMTVAHNRLRQWLEHVKKLSEQVVAEKARIKAAAEEAVRGDRVRRKEAEKARPAKTPDAPKKDSKPTVGRSSRPTLSLAERTLLSKNRGCFKCRQPFVNHQARTCPNGRPKVEEVMPITQEYIDSFRSTAPTDKQAIAKAEDVPADETDNDFEDQATEYVLSPDSHLLPECYASASRDSSPIRVRPLIDTGSTLVLIDAKVADRLQLKRFPLRRPMTIGLAVNPAGGAKIRMTEWVKFRMKSADGEWSSKIVRARVVPDLCYDMVLGMPFLRRNHMMIDAERRTVTNKNTGYNLMAARYPRKRRPTKKRQPSIKANQSPVHHSADVLAAVRERIEVLALAETFDQLDEQAKAKYCDRFPEKLPNVSALPSGIQHNIKLKDIHKSIAAKSYACPKKYREAWQILIRQHVEAGRLRRSDSPYSSPAFLIPKSDPADLPRMVCDYRALNANTVRDRTPLPRIDEIINDCARGRIFGKIDMTNAFFQTRMNPEHVPLTAINTPFGLYEWTVMPMGLCNSPATQQRRVTRALEDLIGRICHVYLDDIIIWSETITEHWENIGRVMEALRKEGLFCSNKKTQLFCSEVKFLGHIVSARGVEADPAKVARIMDWPRPRRTKDVRAFLGVVRYIAMYLPRLVIHTSVLTPLTKREYDKAFPIWTERHQAAFDGIKQIVVSRECLTTVDHDSGETIFVTTDASDQGTGAVLSVGHTWKEARPVAFESAQYNSAEKNYPVHERELLAIVRALKKWRVYLLGVHFEVYTDHKTLKFINTQRDLSRRQARWAEFLSQYDFTLNYLKGEENSVADALSRYPDAEEKQPTAMVAAIGLAREPDTEEGAPSGAALQIRSEPELLRQIREGYRTDEYCIKLRENLPSIAGAREADGLLFVGSRLVIPKAGELRQMLYQLAHDELGHFGPDKSYLALRDAYYWPNMRRDLERSYIPGCDACQRNKSPTTRPAGPLHPLPIPDKRFDSVAIDFIGPLPEDEGFNGIVTMTDRLGSADVRIEPVRMDMTAEEFARLFFDKWYCENGLPLEIISDRDRLFMSRFWTALHQLAGVKVKMSSAYHPETDGASERTNKTVNQLLRFYVDREQQNWVRRLPRVRFCIMNTINASTGYSPFQLRQGFSPRLIPPLVPPAEAEDQTAEGTEALRAMELLSQLQRDVADAQDALLAAKTRQAHHANRHRAAEDVFQVGDQVMLSTRNRRREYKAGHPGRAAKFMPRFDGPYFIIAANPAKSVYTLELPDSRQTFPGFHASQLKRYIPNDDGRFPERALDRPEPIDAERNIYEVSRIVDERRRGRGWQYLVEWAGYGEQGREWKSGHELKQTARDVLRDWQQTHPRPRR